MSSNTPLISVVMPSFNSEKYISLAIESVLNQTIKDFEFIIIDGCSIDKTEEIVQAYSKSDKRIIFIKYEKKGIGEALKYGCSIARGKYLVRMDSDDISMPKRFENQIKVFEKNKAVVLVTSAVVYIDGDNNVTGRSFPYFTKSMFLKNPSIVVHPAVMMLRDKYVLSGGYAGIIRAEDNFLWKKLMKYGDFYMIKDPQIKYRLLPGSLSHSLNSKFDKLLNMFLENKLKKTNVTEADVEDINNFILENLPPQKMILDINMHTKELNLYYFLKKLLGDKMAIMIVFALKYVYGLFFFKK